MAPDEHDADAPEGGARRVRRSSGERARLQREMARGRRTRVLRWVLLAGAVGALLVLAGPSLGGAAGSVGDTIAGWFTRDAQPAADPSAAPSADPDASGDTGRTTLLVATVDDSVAGGTAPGATGLQLLQIDPETGRGVIVFMPASLLTDVPGYGLLQVGEAGGFGGAPLLELSVENALGVAVDATLTMTEQSWGSLFSRVGGFEVDVRQPLSVRGTDGAALRRFESGTQFLDGPRLAELLVIAPEGEPELSRFPRAQQVLEGFLAAAGDSSTGGGLDEVYADGAPMLLTPTPDVTERVLRGLVAAAASGTLEVRTLPVTAVGAGDEAYYELDATLAADFVRDVLGGATAGDTSVGDGVRLEVLNGNGRVGVGAEVASLLVPLGHTVVITRNADDFSYTETIVRVHGSTDELLAVGQEILDALGVGRLEISSVPSSTVDVTIVVGADFRS